MFSYTAASAPAPNALSMALLILSFGMDCALAFATAAASDALLSGFGSLPRRAATVMLRLSFEKSAERFASCAPLRCLVVAHLECPDMRDPFYVLLAGSGASRRISPRSHKRQYDIPSQLAGTELVKMIETRRAGSPAPGFT